MAIIDRLKRLLDAERVPYLVWPHREVFTAPEVAATSEFPAREVAKVLVVRDGDGASLMVVLPALCRLSLVALERASGRRDLALATESQFKGLFSDCEVGAMPPFGNLYGLPVYVDTCFARDRALVFPAGNHREVVEMPFQEFERLVKPEKGALCSTVALAA